MIKPAQIEKKDNCIYLVQDLYGADLYEKSKAIVNFCDKETKLLEREIDRAILEIFERNGINISSTSKSALKRAFDTLKGIGKDILVDDNYNIVDLYNAQMVKNTKLFSIWLEDERYLQCGVEIIETKYLGD